MTTHTLNLDELAASLANGQHSVFAPSSSAMWLECPGSLIPNVLAEDDGNPDSAYGTVAHAVTEAWLTLGRKPVHMLGKKHFVPAGEWGYQIVADEEMFSYAKECVDRCVMLPGQHFIEQRVDFSDLTPIPKQGGTLDFAAYDDSTRTLYVVDHKFGSSPNNIVYAERNPQLMLYGWGMGSKVGGDEFPDRFVFRINQPRLNHFDEWECSLEELTDFVNHVEQRAALAWQIDAPRNPGIKQCQWCKVKSTCAAFATLNEQITAAVFGPVSDDDVRDFKARLDGDYEPHVVTPSELSTGQLAKILPYRSTMESWLKSVAEELELRAMRGEKIPRYKLVESRTKRRFKSRSAAEKHLLSLGLKRNQIIREKLVSPAQAEDLLIAAGHARADLPDLLSSAVEKPAGKPTLAPDSDKRPVWTDPSSVAFGDLTATSDDEGL